MHVRIELFGEASFAVDGTPWRFTAPPKTLPLLALLALRNEPIGRGSLATLLWPDEADADARANLRRHLHALVKALPEIDSVEWIRTHGQTLQWNHAAPASIDVVDFVRLSSDPSTQAEAARLYRGDLLSPNYDEAIIVERDRLRNIHLHALYELAQQARATRDFPAATTYAEQILAMDEWREDALRLLMSVRYAAGDRSGALAAFERFARRLRDELRTDPMFETLALRDAMLNDTLPHESGPAASNAAQPRPLIGRDDALEQVQAMWLRAADGAGGTAFIAGEAGIGKSRFAQEVLARIELQGGRTAVGRTSQPESVPYQPVVEALRQLVPFMRMEPGDERWVATLAPAVPELRRLLPAIDDAPSLEGERAQLRLHEAILRAIEASARIRPVAIVLEDLHVANAATLDAIGSLVERLGSVRAYLLLTYRTTDTDADSPVRALRRRLQRSSRAAHLSLPRLDAGDVARIVELAHDGAPVDLAARVYGVSEGNPLFIWQLLHRFAEQPGADTDEGAIDSVGDAIRQRLGILTPSVRAVAEVAATIGDTFSVEEIAGVGGWDESVVFDALATLLDRQIVGERAGDAFEYGFTHALIGSAIYDAISVPARRARHRRAAEVLERTRAQHGRGYALIAQHWERAHEPERARSAYLRGARAALAAYARPDAHKLAQRVLDSGATGVERFHALQIIIASTDKSGDIETAQRALDELDELADTLDAPEQYEAFVTRIRFHEHHSQRDAQARAIDRLAAFANQHDNRRWAIEAVIRRAALTMQRGGTSEAERTLTQAGPPEAIEDPKQRYRYYSQLAQSVIRQGRYDEGKRHLRSFREFLRLHPSIEGESLYASAEHKYAWLLEDAPYIKRTVSRIIELAQARGDLLDEANGRIDLAYVTHQLHDSAGARQEFERALELFAACQSWQGWVNTRINYGVMEREIGHLERARTFWMEGRERGLQIGVRFAIVIVDTNLTELALHFGDAEAALVHAQAAYDRNAESGERRLDAETQVMLGAALCRNGEMRRGTALLESGIALSRSMKHPRMFAAHLTTYLEELLRASKPRVSAHVIANELFELFDAAPLDHQHPGRICWALASYLRATRRNGDAERLLARARDILSARLEAFTMPEDAEAFARMIPNAWIFERRHV